MEFSYAYDGSNVTITFHNKFLTCHAFCNLQYVWGAIMSPIYYVSFCLPQLHKICLNFWFITVLILFMCLRCRLAAIFWFCNIRICTRCYNVSLCLCNYSDGGRSNSGSIFISGFVLGGLIVGTLGCVYAPQVVIFNKYISFSCKCAYNYYFSCGFICYSLL